MANLDFDNKNIIITGGTSGIGLGIARAFLQENAKIGLISRSKDRLDNAKAQLQAEFSHAVIALEAADVGNAQNITKAIEILAKKLGGIDHLVTSAGISGETGISIKDVTEVGFLQVLNTNVAGVFFAVKAAYDFLHQAKNPSVTIIGSDSGFVAAANMLAYNASKGALVQLTRALAVEFADNTNIRVNSVCPSIVDTPMARGDMGDAIFENPPFPISSPADIAYLVLSLASPKARAVNGVSLLADFGYHARSSFPA